MAIFNIVTLGAALAVDELTRTLVAEGEDGSFWYYLGDFAVGVFEKLADAISFLIGFDITALNPTNFFLVTYLLILGYGVLVLLAIYLIYKVRFLKPLSGRGAGLKIGMLLLAMVGYSIPLLNLFPWFFPWTAAVWRRPK